MSLPIQDLDHMEKARRRRLVLAAIFRTLRTTVVVIAVYCVLPVHYEHSWGVLVRLMGCLAAFVAILVWQVKGIVSSDQPRVRAVETVATAIPLLIVSFAYTYVSLSAAQGSNFSQSLDRATSVYFTTTVLSTVGFGDITPVTTMARMVVTLQMVLDLVIMGTIVRLLINAAQAGVARKASEAAANAMAAAGGVPPAAAAVPPAATPSPDPG